MIFRQDGGERTGKSALKKLAPAPLHDARHSLNSPRPERTDPNRTGAATIAADTVRTWDLAQSRLAPIIGENGFRVLFARSLHRARIEHPWLARGPGTADVPFSLLKASLESQTPEHAEDGSRALMTQFNELLNALIGEQLAARLLSQP